MEELIETLPPSHRLAAGTFRPPRDLSRSKDGLFDLSSLESSLGRQSPFDRAQRIRCALGLLLSAHLSTLSNQFEIPPADAMLRADTARLEDLRESSTTSTRCFLRRNFLIEEYATIRGLLARELCKLLRSKAY